MNDPAPSEGAEKRHDQQGSGHLGLVFGAAVLVTAGTILAGVYGVRSGALVLKVLALDGVLVCLAAWLSLHAFRIRHRLVDAEQWERQASQEWDEADEEAVNVTLQDVYHARTIHFAVLALPVTAIVGFLAVYLLWTQPGSDVGPALQSLPSGTTVESAEVPLEQEGQGQDLLPRSDTAAASVICLIACCLWLVLSRSFEAFRGDDLPEAPSLMLGFRDLQWTTLLVAGGILGSRIWPKEGFWGDGEPWSPPEIWVARLILVWVVAISLEQVVRVVLAWLRRDWTEKGFVSPTYLVLREAVFVRGNPIASLFETIEARFGVSFRSSWAIRFVRAAALPSLVAVLLLFWGLTCLSVVGTDEMGIRESFGRIRGDLFPASIQSKLPWHFSQISDEPLPPGLHVKLPWPFGRIRHYPVKKVFSKPIGFVPSPGQQRAYLWTKAHAEEEFALVLGNDAQVVAVNALVYYKIREDKQGFLDYVYQFSDSPEDGAQGNPVRTAVDTALDAYAHRVLMEETRSATLEEVLSANRAEFADRLEQSLREYATENRLGIDVIDVALVLMHPPIEAAKDYLDVISAEIEADRVQIQARGEHNVAIETAKTESYAVVAQAKVDAADKVGKAYEESAEFLAVAEAYTAAPEAFKQRLWFETHEEALADQPMIIVDEEVYIDMRPNPQTLNIFPSGAP